MKLQFVSYDNIDIIKSNLKSWVDNFKQDSSDWLQDELGNALFSDTKFAEIPDFSLDMSADKPFLTEAENVKRIYGNLRFLSDSQASDERLSVSYTHLDVYKSQAERHSQLSTPPETRSGLPFSGIWRGRCRRYDCYV